MMLSQMKSVDVVDASSIAEVRQVLLPVHSASYFVELFRVGQLLKNIPGYKAVFLFGWHYPTISRDIKKCLHQGFKCLDEGGREIEIQRQEAAVQSIMHRRSFIVRLINAGLTRIKRLVSWSSFWGERIKKSLSRKFREFVGSVTAKFDKDFVVQILNEILIALDYYLKRINFAEWILHQDYYSLIVMAGDNVGYDTACFIKVAHQLNIPVVLVPSTMSNGVEEAEVYYHDKRFHESVGFINRLASGTFPHWTRVHKGRKILRRPGNEVIAMEWLGLAPHLPWVFCSGYADVIAAESDAMVKYYLEAGLPPEKLALVGALGNDVLAEYMKNALNRREKLYVELGLPPGRPMILTALPSDFLYLPGGRPECDFDDYDDLVRFWMEVLNSVKEYNTVVALHPSVNKEEMKRWETDRIKIGNLNTAAMVPLCDLYVSSASSTVRWAIACGKPVVNYDVYRYRHTDYLDVEGVIIVEEQEEYASIVTKITQDSTFFEKIAARQKAVAREWGVLDGQSGLRMLELFDQLINCLSQ